MFNKSILIVDDSPFIAERLLKILEILENKGPIRYAGDYDSAIQWIEKERPDIVLLDIHLPGKSGFELLQYIKARYPGVIVIMLTNQTGDYYKKTSAKLGASYFIDKSQEFEQVPDIISSLVS